MCVRRLTKLGHSVSGWLIFALAAASCAGISQSPPSGGTGGQSGPQPPPMVDASTIDITLPDVMFDRISSSEVGCTGATAAAPGCDPCGNGQLEPPGESCDDHNTLSDVGCSSVCELVAVWTCPFTWARFLPLCGDGKLMGSEACDD